MEVRGAFVTSTHVRGLHTPSCDSWLLDVVWEVLFGPTGLILRCPSHSLDVSLWCPAARAREVHTIAMEMGLDAPRQDQDEFLGFWAHVSCHVYIMSTGDMVKGSIGEAGEYPVIQVLLCIPASRSVPRSVPLLKYTRPMHKLER